MDEILIEEKKYVSSKQAAKVTGYAKDYIGQLCREGRVPARLVGRSWYVLESAIHDHRFGEQKAMQEEREPRASSPIVSPAWESPRYESSATEALPTVNRLRDAEQGAVDMSKNLQDSWKAWFDRVAEAAPAIPDVIPEKREEQEEVSVPIRAVYRQLPEELLPRRTIATRAQSEEYDDEEPVQEGQGSRRGLMMTLQLAGASLAILMAVLAVLGSGYFDTYILSHKQVGAVAGVYLYNR